VANADVELVGPFPAELDNKSEFAAATMATATEPAATQAFIEFLTSPAAAAAFERRGLVPGIN
jgi:molybdate transport system substrate-binding protein